MSPLPKALTLDIVTPDKAIVHEEVDEVQLPGWEGALGILPGHTPLLAMLKPGELWYRKGQDKTFFVLDFGMAEVLPDKVTVLVRLADKPEEIDVAKQESDRKAAESELQSAVSVEDAERARIAMLTAMMKLRAAERVRMKRGI
jgi:F-type H+-transporting ATPase subunit epsilon